VGAVVVLGPDELAADRATLRDMATHEERQVALAEVPYALAELLGLAVEEDGCGCGCADHDHDHGEACGCGCC
jgi:hypothetical protein